MLDPTAAYRTTQVVCVSRAGQVVLLYQGAIRFATQHLAWLEQNDIERAHKASIRCQEIVAALRGALDLSVGPVAARLDRLYEFVLDRLVAGNVAKQPKPTEEAIQVLRDLLEAWQEIASRPASASDAAPFVALHAPIRLPESEALVGATYGSGGR